MGEIEAEKQDSIRSIKQAVGEPEKLGALAEIEKIKFTAIDELIKKKQRIVEAWEGLTPKNVELSLGIPIWYLILVAGFSLIALGFSIAAILR